MCCQACSLAFLRFASQEAFERGRPGRSEAAASVPSKGPKEAKDWVHADFFLLLLNIDMIEV